MGVLTEVNLEIEAIKKFKAEGHTHKCACRMLWGDGVCECGKDKRHVVGENMEVSKQLDEWVKGNPIHNQDRDECCPDFSCCNGNMAPEEERKRFAKAHYEGDEETKKEMLMMFLGNAFSDKNIYFAGSKANYNQPV